MKQKTYYTVIVSIHVGEYRREYCHIDVQEYYQQGEMLVIRCLKKEVHQYELSRVEQIQVRAYQCGVIV